MEESLFLPLDAMVTLVSTHHPCGDKRAVGGLIIISKVEG